MVSTTSLTIGAIFLGGVLLAVPMGWIFRVRLSDNRYTHIDGMRAISALMVVCAHYLVHARLIAKEPVWSPINDTLGAVGVQIFFCITGFLFTRKALAGPLDVPALISSRVRRIVPLYLVAMTAAICLALYITPGVPTLREIAQDYAYGFLGGAAPTLGGMSMVGQIGQAWTLSWEWGFYAALPFIAVAVARPAWAFLALAAAVGCMAYQATDKLQPWAFFVPGIVCALVESRVRLNDLTKGALTAVGLVAFGYALALPEPIYGWAQMALCSIGFPALLFGSRWLLSLKPLRLLGEVSYSIYLLHLVIAAGATTYIQTNWDIYKTVDDKLPVAVAALVGMFVACFATYALVERPFMVGAIKRNKSRPFQGGPTASPLASTHTP